MTDEATLRDALRASLEAELERHPSLPTLSEEQRAALVTHGALLSRWNRVHNLTRLERPEDVARRHFLDSLSGLAALERQVPALGSRMADVGTGAGFPGVVAALLWPAREVVLIEAARKRASFLHQVAQQLGLRNLRIQNAREEEVPAGGFDLVVSRATFPWQELPRLGRLLASGGWLGAWVSDQPSESEWKAALAAAPESGLTDGARVPYEVKGLPERAVLMARRT